MAVSGTPKLTLLSNLARPLQEIIRPLSLKDYVGQEHLIDSDDGAISSFLTLGILPSMILYGPPGVGKTTLAHILAAETNHVFLELSATDSTIGDMREILQAIRQENGKRDRLGDLHLKVVVFIDEIHRFSTTQQDFLLPFVEAGDFVFIGATTVNPEKRIRRAILSRCQLFLLRKLDIQHIVKVLQKASLHENIRRKKLKGLKFIQYSTEAFQLVASYANGDTRSAINFIELISSRMEGDDWLLSENEYKKPVDIHVVQETINSLTKVRLGLQHQENEPIVAALFDSMNGGLSASSILPLKGDYVLWKHEDNTFFVRIKLNAVTFAVSDLESDIDDVQFGSACKEKIISQNGSSKGMEPWVEHVDFSDDSDTEPGPVYSDDDERFVPLSTRISYSKHRKLTSVHLLLQLLNKGEQPMFLAKQLILYACAYTDPVCYELPKLFSTKKSMEKANVNILALLSDCVQRLSNSRKLQTPSLIEQSKAIRSFLQSNNSIVEEDVIPCADLPIIFDEELKYNLLHDAMQKPKGDDLLDDIVIVDHVDDHYTMGF